jgi:hypothetical protein
MVLRPTRGCRYYARVPLPERGLKAEDEVRLVEQGISEAHAFQFWQAGVFGVIDERAPLAHVTMRPSPGETVTFKPAEKQRKRGR